MLIRTLGISRFFEGVLNSLLKKEKRLTFDFFVLSGIFSFWSEKTFYVGDFTKSGFLKVAYFKIDYFLEEDSTDALMGV